MLQLGEISPEGWDWARRALAAFLIGLFLIKLVWKLADEDARASEEKVHSAKEAESRGTPAEPEMVREQDQVPAQKPEQRPDVGPPLDSAHELAVLRVLALQKMFKQAETLPDTIKRSIWQFVGDRPSVVATGCADGQARIFNLRSGKQLVSVRHDATNRDPIHSVHLTSRAGRGPLLLTGSWDGRWHEWESWPSRPSRPSEFLRGEAGVGHDNQLTALALSRNGNLLACACSAGAVLLFRRNCPTRELELTEQEEVMELKEALKLGDHGDFVVQTRIELASGEVIEPQDQLLPEASLDGFKKRSALDDLELPARLRFRFVGCMTHGYRKAWRSLEHGGAVLCMVLAAEGASEFLYSGSRDRQIRKWSLPDGCLVATYSGHTSMVRCVALNSRYLASGSDDRTVRLWRMDAPETVRTIPAHKDFVRAVALCSTFQERLVSAGDDLAVILWDASSGQKLCEYAHPCVAAALLLEGSLLASAGEDGRLRIWSAESGILQHTMKHPQRLTSLAWLQM